MPSTSTLLDYFGICGNPNATPAEIEAWSTLTMTTSATAEVKVGLFGYDMTCLAGWCAATDNLDGDPAAVDDFNGYCGLIDARGLDGLAFGIYWKAPLAGNNYGVGFRNDEVGSRLGNTVHFNLGPIILNYYLTNFY